MKSLFCTLALVAAFVASGALYPAAMRVTEVDAVFGIVYAETKSGDVFTYCDDEANGLAPGDLVSCLVFSGFTPGLEDDEIWAAVPSGWRF